MFPRAYWALIASSFGVFASVGMAAFLVPQTAVASLGVTVAASGLLTAGFLLASTFTRPMWADLASRIPSALLFGVAAAVYVLGLAAVAVASGFWSALVIRTVTGAAQGCVYLLSAAGIIGLAPPRLVGRALSLSSLAVFAGLAVGPLIADLVRRSYGDDAAWGAAAAVALVLIVPGWLAMRRMPAPQRHSTARVPLVALLAPAALLAAGAVTYGAFQAVMPLYVPQVTWRPVSLLFTVLAVSVMAAQLLVSVVTDRIDPRVLGVLGLGSAAASAAIFAVSRSFGGLLTGAAVLGVSTALMYPAVARAVIAPLPWQARTRALAILSPGFEVGQAAGAMMSTALSGAAGYRGSFIWCAVVAVLGLALVPSMRPPRWISP